ncbi:hypothetical protein B0H11DRAFT_1920742 [Mycena galericulata]|nr:hypothetical protein B0H11DRAFT_1920742 [Mycena galericulata]
MSTTDSKALAELLTAILQNRQNNYSNGKYSQSSHFLHSAALTVLAYDILLTMDSEVTYIWGARWSIPKALYLFGRYYGVLYLTALLSVGTNRNLTVESANFKLWAIPMLNPLLVPDRLVLHLVVVPTFGIMALGVKFCSLPWSTSFSFCGSMHCTTEAKKRNGYEPTGELIGELLITSVALERTSKNAYVNPPGVPLPGCLSVRNTDFSLVAWVPALAVSGKLSVCSPSQDDDHMFEAAFFLLTVAKLVNLLYDSDGKFKLSQMKEMRFLSPLISAFILDGTVFFLLLAIVLACAVIDLTVKGALAPVGTPWLIATYSFSVGFPQLLIHHHFDPPILQATRLILNIRKLAAGDMNNTLDVSALRFGSAHAQDNSTGVPSAGSRRRNGSWAGHSDSYAAYFGE